MTLPRKRAHLCDSKDGGSIVNPLRRGAVMCTGHGNGNTGETQRLLEAQGRDGADQGFQNFEFYILRILL